MVTKIKTFWEADDEHDVNPFLAELSAQGAKVMKMDSHVYPGADEQVFLCVVIVYVQ